MGLWLADRIVHGIGAILRLEGRNETDPNFYEALQYRNEPSEQDARGNRR